MNKNIYTILLFCLIHQFSIAQDISLEGTIWLDYDENGQYDDEVGISDVKVYLINADSSEILDSAFTIGADFNFPSTNSFTIPPGTYYLEIAAEEFTLGGDLQNITSCLGSNDANDGVDLDDNGLDMIPIQTTNFSLDTGLVEHIDFCLTAPCNEPNALAAVSCDAILEVDLFCDISILGTFCNVLPSADSGGIQPNPLCPDGGSSGNISWFAFVAFGGDYSITISPTACMGSTFGMDGIQVGIYTDCTFSESVFCSPACSEDPIYISSDHLDAGQTYYLFIDGCGGSVCSYSIDIESTPIPPDLSVDEICFLDNGSVICLDSTLMPGAEITFQVDDFESDIEYFWEIITISGTPYSGDTLPITDINTLDLKFDDEGIYLVCITGISNGCQSFISSGELCRTITVENSVGTKELDESVIKITPNPAFDYISIDGDFSFSEATFIIYCIDGERVMSGMLDSSGKIDVMGLNAGLYLIGVVGDGGEFERLGRFVK